MGAVWAGRLARFHVNREGAWLIPALLGAAVTAYLSWGAWVSATTRSGCPWATPGGGRRCSRTATGRC